MKKGFKNLWFLDIKNLLFISPFLFPFYLFRFKLIGIPFTVLELFSYVLFFLYLLSRRLKLNKTLNKYLFSIFLFLIAAIIGVVVAPDNIVLPLGVNLDSKRLALGVFKGWVFVPVLYFFVFSQVLSTKKDIDNILRNFTYSAAFVSLISYFLGIFGNGITYDFRLNGLFESANYLSLFLVPALLLCMYFVLQRKKPFSRYYYLDLASLVIMVHALLFTKSYAAILGVFGAIGISILYFILFKAKNRRKYIIAFSSLVLTFILIILSQLNSPKFKQFLDFENRSSTSVRLEIYQTSIALIKKEPITGVGLGLFQARYQNNIKQVLGRFPMEWNMPHPHNIFLAFWINTGIIGLFAFLSLLFLSHKKITYPLIPLWGILIHGMFDVPFWKNDLAMIFWLIIGSIVVLQMIKE